MKTVPLSQLENLIVRPGFEKHLKPLIMYRGNVTLGDAHRMWNLLVSAMEQDCSLSDITQRLQHGPEFSHLCGPEKRKPHTSLCSFLTRLEDNQKVCGEMPHLLDYSRSLGGHRWHLERVSQVTHRTRNMGAGGWRTFKSRPATPREFREALTYPFLIHDGGRPEHDLLKRVNAAVSRAYKPHMRADICQDIIVGILSGEFDPDDLHLPVREMTKRVFALSMEKWGDISLDAALPGTDDFSLLDTLTEEDSLWARI